jgi:hypothetical protein
MKREELTELHYITPIVNVPSVLRLGILSHRRTDRVPHESAALESVQARRESKHVPGGRPLHDYVNLYICARNPMLCLRRQAHERLCVLNVHVSVLDLPRVVIADRNAASDYVRFGPAPEALARIDASRVFAGYWTHPDRIEEWRRKSFKCAEVLVPDRVAPGYVLGARVSCEAARVSLTGVAPGLNVQVDAHFFFL